MARAAGIGEGTIFRVFTDKEALLAACMEEALWPDDTVAHLEGIALDQPLRSRLTEAVEVMRGYEPDRGCRRGAGPRRKGGSELGRRRHGGGPATARGRAGRTPCGARRAAGTRPGRAAPRARTARRTFRLEPERLAGLFASSPNGSQDFSS
ncbi:TetR/AcrR family transcriptional regulator [Streptomyces albus]